MSKARFASRARRRQKLGDHNHAFLVDYPSRVTDGRSFRRDAHAAFHGGHAISVSAQSPACAERNRSRRRERTFAIGEVSADSDGDPDMGVTSSGCQFRGLPASPLVVVNEPECIRQSIRSGSR
jgi:hypothetical protein